MPEILDALASYGIEANRKSIYTDMDALEQYGMDIIKTLETNLSTYDATLLEREVTVTGRVKNMNENIRNEFENLCYPVRIT
jgi:hypothetical protein